MRASQSPPQRIQTVRIFLASPSADTQEARCTVVAAIAAIQNEPSYRHLLLDLWRWDNKQRRIVCDRSHNPQHDIEHQIGNPGDCDLVIGLFARTMGGTLLDQPPFGHHPSGRLWHCSEWEVEQGLQSQRRRLTGDPTGVTRGVWVFHDTSRPSDVWSWPRDKRNAFLAEVDAVQDFVDRANQPGQPLREGKNFFASPADLDDLIRQGLRDWLSREFPATAAPPPATTRRDREQAHLRALVERLAQHEPRYVPLAGTETPEQRLERVLQDVVMPSDVVFEAFGFGAGGGLSMAAPAPKPVTYTDVLDAYRALPQRGTVRRLAVLGEPGAGKSFSLGRIACELARQALDDATRPVPVLVALGLWTDPKESLDTFMVRCSLPPPPRHLSSGNTTAETSPPLSPADLQALRAERRLILLLDAVNEIPPGQRGDKAAAIARLAQDEHLAALVLSCRQRDFEAELQARLPFDTLRLQPLRPWQVRDFLRQTLVLAHGEAEGWRRAEEKFWQIAGGEAMREVWLHWEQAGGTLELFWTAEKPPTELVEQYPSLLWRDYPRRQRLNDRRSLIRLAENPFLLFVMMQLPALPPNRAQLFGGFLKVLHERESAARHLRGDGATGPALPAWRAVLVQVAEALQRADGSEGDDGARTALARADWPVALTEDMLAFSIDASVLQRVGDELRFTHQLQQESLAADLLLHASRSNQRPASDFWPEHHGWTRTGWEVVAEIAAEACAGDAAAQVRLIDWLAQTAPNVAADVWQHAGRPALPAELLARSQAQWLPRMTDIKREPNPAARAAIGRWLGVTGLDNRPGTGLRADGLPDIEWVEFNDGLPFIYQDAEHPGLPPFALSRYLVTHRQFQAFVEAEDGYGNSRWWQGFEARQTAASQPAAWQESNCPRESVNWFEATAFCRWLSYRLRQPISLPNERQWERAARGRDGWQYQSAAEDYPIGHANADESQLEGGVYLQRTSAVGLYPQGATQEGGLLDMAGNVWEWCADLYDPDSEPDGGRVLRGGSWVNYPEVCARPSAAASTPTTSTSGTTASVFGSVVRPPSEVLDAGATDR